MSVTYMRRQSYKSDATKIRHFDNRFVCPARWLVRFTHLPDNINTKNYTNLFLSAIKTYSYITDLR
jgi:hypothetical protein